MNIQINTEKKEITLHEPVTLVELAGFIDKALTGEQCLEYKILSHVIVTKEVHNHYPETGWRGSSPFTSPPITYTTSGDPLSLRPIHE